MTNYSVLKRAVPLDEAAERYGTVRRGFMLCPFHADKVPSLKLYGDHFHCFGCGAHGDVVDLAAGLLGCSKAKEYAEACRLGEWTDYLLEACAPDLPIKRDRICTGKENLFRGRRFSAEREFCRKRLSVAYNEGASAPETWLRFLGELLYPEDIPTLQEFMGYCLLPTKLISILF